MVRTVAAVKENANAWTDGPEKDAICYLATLVAPNTVNVKTVHAFAYKDGTGNIAQYVSEGRGLSSEQLTSDSIGCEIMETCGI